MGYISIDFVTCRENVHLMQFSILSATLSQIKQLLIIHFTCQISPCYSISCKNRGISNHVSFPFSCQCQHISLSKYLSVNLEMAHLEILKWGPYEIEKTKWYTISWNSLNTICLLNSLLQIKWLSLRNHNCGSSDLSLEISRRMKVNFCTNWQCIAIF